MNSLKHDDLLRLIPGLSDHAALEILESGAGVGDVEAALLIVQGNDVEALRSTDASNESIAAVVAILSEAEVEATSGRTR